MAGKSLNSFQELSDVYGIKKETHDEKPHTNKGSAGGSNRYAGQSNNGGNGRGGYGSGNGRYSSYGGGRELPQLTGLDTAGKAEKVMKWIKEGNPKKFDLTTSKIRCILSMTNQIYNKAIYGDETLKSELVDEIQYLKVRIVYECGRETPKYKKVMVKGEVMRVGPVEEFVRASCLLEELDKVGESRKAFLEFSRYLEALVAYHRYLGGKDA